MRELSGAPRAWSRTQAAATAAAAARRRAPQRRSAAAPQRASGAHAPARAPTCTSPLPCAGPPSLPTWAPTRIRRHPRPRACAPPSAGPARRARARARRGGGCSHAREARASGIRLALAASAVARTRPHPERSGGTHGGQAPRLRGIRRGHLSPSAPPCARASGNRPRSHRTAQRPFPSGDYKRGRAARAPACVARTGTFGWGEPGPNPGGGLAGAGPPRPGGPASGPRAAGDCWRAPRPRAPLPTPRPAGHTAAAVKKKKKRARNSPRRLFGMRRDHDITMTSKQIKRKRKNERGRHAIPAIKKGVWA